MPHKNEENKIPTTAELINDLFRAYRHPEGREYTHKEIEAAIIKAAGKKLIDASYLSKIRTGAIKSPGIHHIEALCFFFPIDVDYFFPQITAIRKKQTDKQPPVYAALQSVGADPDAIKKQLEILIRTLNIPQSHKTKEEEK